MIKRYGLLGDPKKLKKKYETPRHPWSQSTLEIEKAMRREYGLRNRKEILIANSFLKKYKDMAKRLIANQTAQGEREKEQMMGKLQRLGLLVAGAELDDVLSLELKDVLNRRLQSVLLRKGLARSMRQARQFIVHRHVSIGEKEMTAPGYLISLEEEAKLTFSSKSSLTDEDHPERSMSEQQAIKKEAQAIREKPGKKTEDETEGPADQPEAAPAQTSNEEKAK